MFQPILSGRNPPEIFFDMLFADESHRNRATVAIDDGYAKQAFQQEDAFGVMTQCPVAEVGKERLRFVERDGHTLPMKSLRPVCAIDTIRFTGKTFKLSEGVHKVLKMAFSYPCRMAHRVPCPAGCWILCGAQR